MKIILSTTVDDNYLFFLPITVWAWKQMGYEAVVIVPLNDSFKLKKVIDFTLVICPSCKFCYLPDIGRYKESTIFQCARLYASAIYWDGWSHDEYLLLSDIDMIPLSKEYFTHDQTKINYIGHDLTDFQHIPICYVGMSTSKWKEVMNIGDGLLEPEMKTGMAPFKDNWGMDQDMLTDKMKAYGLEKCNSIHRGKLSSGQAKGRICRAYGFDIETPSPIDAHMQRPGYEPQAFAQIIALIKKTWPSENVQWIVNYKNDYVK